MKALTINCLTSAPTVLLTLMVVSQAMLYCTSVGFSQHNCVKESLCKYANWYHKVRGSLKALTIKRLTSTVTKLLTHMVVSQATLYSTSVGLLLNRKQIHNMLIGVVK